MIKRVLSLVALVAVLGISAQALEVKKYIGIGYANAEVGEISQSGVCMDIGFKFGDTIKQRIGGDFVFLNEDPNSGAGNIANFYYNLGYEVVDSLIPNISVGYMIQTFEEEASAGLSYGLGVEYEISKSFSAEVSYKLSTLELIDSEYEVSIIRANIAYKF